MNFLRRIFPDLAEQPVEPAVRLAATGDEMPPSELPPVPPVAPETPPQPTIAEEAAALEQRADAQVEDAKQLAADGVERVAAQGGDTATAEAEARNLVDFAESLRGKIFPVRNEEAPAELSAPDEAVNEILAEASSPVAEPAPANSEQVELPGGTKLEVLERNEEGAPTRTRAVESPQEEVSAPVPQPGRRMAYPEPLPAVEALPAAEMGERAEAPVTPEQTQEETTIEIPPMPEQPGDGRLRQWAEEVQSSVAHVGRGANISLESIGELATRLGVEAWRSYADELVGTALSKIKFKSEDRLAGVYAYFSAKLDARRQKNVEKASVFDAKMQLSRSPLKKAWYRMRQRSALASARLYAAATNRSENARLAVEEHANTHLRGPIGEIEGKIKLAGVEVADAERSVKSFDDAIAQFQGAVNQVQLEITRIREDARKKMSFLERAADPAYQARMQELEQELMQYDQRRVQLVRERSDAAVALRGARGKLDTLSRKHGKLSDMFVRPHRQLRTTDMVPSSLKAPEAAPILERPNENEPWTPEQVADAWLGLYPDMPLDRIRLQGVVDAELERRATRGEPSALTRRDAVVLLNQYFAGMHLDQEAFRDAQNRIVGFQNIAKIPQKK